VQRGKISLGTEYIVPLDTDFEKWVYDFGHNTHTSYVRERTEYNTGNDEFRYTYKCHRSGKYESQAGQNPMKKARINQKGSKNIGCKSAIIITKTKGDCPRMIIKYTSHSNHIPGSDNDIGALRLSKQIQDYIAQRMRDCLDVKAISQIFRKRAHDLDKIWSQREHLKAVQIRDHLITYDDICNVWKESLNLWQHKLLENNDLTCAIAQPESNNNEDKGQLFGFIIPVAREIVYYANTVLLDATHGTNKENDQLYTLLTPDFKTGKGLPIAHLISSLDCDPAQIKALQNIFPKSKILLCWWHVLRAWRENLKKVYIEKANMISNGKLNSEIKTKMKDELWDDLRELMQIDNRESVDEKQWLNESDNQTSEIDKTMWIKAYRLDVPHDNLNTTNMLESWHRKLKYDIFDGKPNQPEIRAGRMIPAEREVRQRKQKAKNLIQKITEVLIGCYWIVSSDTKIGVNYSVELNTEFQGQLERQFIFSQPQLQFNLQHNDNQQQLLNEIQKMTESLINLNTHSLQIVRNQLSQVLREVQRIDGFHIGDWIGENKKTQLPPHMNIRR
ncbi:19078_t:CDS:2, partial [Gigaspora margarita]